MIILPPLSLNRMDGSGGGGQTKIIYYCHCHCASVVAVVNSGGGGNNIIMTTIATVWLLQWQIQPPLVAVFVSPPLPSGTHIIKFDHHQTISLPLPLAIMCSLCNLTSLTAI